MEIQEGEKGKETISEAMTNNFPKLMAETKLDIKEAQRMPSRINAKEKKESYTSIPRHVIFNIFKLKKIKEKKILKEKHL